MEKYNERQYYPYSWHQSHDQATVLLMVPYDTQDEDLSVVIDRQYLVVGVKNHPPTIKGKLYSTVDTASSVWQLERHASRLSTRDRTISTTSTASTQSSYALVSSDPDISSSFAASLEVSDAEDSGSSAAVSPTLLQGELERSRNVPPRRRLPSNITSRDVSPGHGPVFRGVQMPSSFSSLESLHSPQSGRLLTIHLEKDKSIIWPSLIVGSVPDSLSPNLANTVVFVGSEELEHQYNMDPTSLALIGLEHADIRKDKEEAFEYFLRAWHQAHVPSATMRLVSLYFPLNATDGVDQLNLEEQPSRGIGGLAQLYLEAGLLHLEGAASSLLAASYSSLSSLRIPLQPPSAVDAGGTEGWKRDREAAARYFQRARSLQPDLDVPVIPPEGGIGGDTNEQEELAVQMPSIDLAGSVTPESVHTDPASDHEVPMVRRRRKKAEMEVIERTEKLGEDIDNAWYLYIPGLVGAGTAILVLGVVGALSFSNWYLPDLIKGDLDSIRPDVRDFYSNRNVPVIEDGNQDATDLMKCVSAVSEREEGQGSSTDIILLGGLSGRLDQTIHTLSYLHKLRGRRRVFAVTDDNIGWVLDSGEHEISIDHSILGQTCGLLPVGIDHTTLSTRGLRWNLAETESSFDGMVSTSNHLVPGQNVWIKTTKPIWWTMELKNIH
ncbi:thiamine pyrophosphokinase [Coprinopsis sp. MPI-PUGE-AT-0042]|nr:thiamine pyrophosphokinase [Coprinopsis sp. MPI-PUGE-AT-0042]